MFLLLADGKESFLVSFRADLLKSLVLLETGWIVLDKFAWDCFSNGSSSSMIQEGRIERSVNSYK